MLQRAAQLLVTELAAAVLVRRLIPGKPLLTVLRGLGVPVPQDPARGLDVGGGHRRLRSLVRRVWLVALHDDPQRSLA